LLHMVGLSSYHTGVLLKLKEDMAYFSDDYRHLVGILVLLPVFVFGYILYKKCQKDSQK
jgi:hypothetical protein